MFETSIPDEHFDRIDLSTRNKLQEELILLCSPQLTDEAEMAWIEKYDRRVSDIIDDTRNFEIRKAIFEDIHKAALLIKDILEEAHNQEMEKVA